tara:strand:+ start:1505 stop:2320 length:816 start_codon:yes stop_codon:yes gene_type:complete
MPIKKEVISACETSDGAGVKIYRSLGQTQNIRLDPLLLLDEFCSENPNDYIGGFPPHPHRGFETFTYMIEGQLKHEDSMGNSGELKSGELQWMTAGSGIIHSEMPSQKNGLMQGFQLWVNLPAKEKMLPPKYRDIKSSEISIIHDGTTRIKILAGKFKNYLGPITGMSTMLEFFDIKVGTDEFIFEGSKGKNYFIYVFVGHIKLNGEALYSRNGISFSKKVIISTDSESRFLLIGGKPLNEPIVQYGPFVMNTKLEIIQAMKDFNIGQFLK